MKLNVYKGFDANFLSSITERPLQNYDIFTKSNVLAFDKKTRKQLDMALLGLEDDDAVWATYEEYTLVKSRVDEAIQEDGLKLVIYKNNLYPDYYPIPFPVSNELFEEITDNQSSESSNDMSESCQRFLAVYNSIISIDESFYGSFYNFEYDKADNISIKDYYPSNLKVCSCSDKIDFSLFLNGDVETYLKDLNLICRTKPNNVSIKAADSDINNRIQKSFFAFCLKNGISIVKSSEMLPEDTKLEKELESIAKNDIGISGFSGFRKIRFYGNHDIDKSTVELSQAQIIQEIIHQAENSYNTENNNSFRDIFITASTGAGKSIMFQIPAVYLAKKHHKLTIIIEPVKALMQDQQEKLLRNGYTRAAAFNSDLITHEEKETVLKKIHECEVDLLYLSPETLLSYSIETIIGEREIGLIIIDEAHIVTTWGVGFRPDYWYLGGYINRLRNQLQTTKGMKRKIYHFPICAFTATAINGGIDDSIGDTIISLSMENPVKYIGYVRRDDISFKIEHYGNGRKIPKVDYETGKTAALNNHISNWLENGEKTIVYFPYAATACDASKGIKEFSGIIKDKRIGVYTGGNNEGISIEAFNDAKRQTFEAFRSGTKSIIFATKAFGMGVDIDDVKNVYHYAVTGNLFDYVQEIGRAARKTGMTGYAITDYYFNDLSYMKSLFGMSQIRQYQIREVLVGIYNTFKNKQNSGKFKNTGSFLISPESFTYIFNGRGNNDKLSCINKLKTCLLMIEKDFYDKYNFKVIISRPQSVFTKAFVCINRDYEKSVLQSEYGKCFCFVQEGRDKEKQADESLISDIGDIFSIDLKTIWEDFYSDISFPQFKYWYFNSNVKSKDKNSVSIMPSIRKYIIPRQKISIESRGELLLNELMGKILSDFEYIADVLYSKFKNQYSPLMI